MMRRIFIYLWEMYPPHHALVGVLLSAAFFVAQFRLHEIAFQLSAPLVVAAISLVFSILLIRILDEFKDYQDDLINFPERPLPSGRVYKKDLSFLLGIVIVVLVAINCWNLRLLLGQLLIGVYSFLMFVWFFKEKLMRKSLPLAFISHHPIVYIYFIYLALAFSVTGISIIGWWMAFPLGFLSTNWELSRKIKSDENEYTTYSKVWGRRAATALAIMCQLVSGIGISFYFALVACRWWFLISFIFGWIALMVPYFISLMSQESQAETFKTYAERLSFFAMVAIFFEVVFL